MARAKSTDRAEARRRHREQLAAEIEGEAALIEAADGGGPTPNVLSDDRGPRRAAPRPADPGARRMGIVEAFRRAVGQSDIRGDLRAFPGIALHTKAVWLPALLVIATGVVFLLPGIGQSQVVTFFVSAILAPPAMIPPFLAGILTQRASWLAGGVTGLVSSLVVAVLVVTSPSLTGSKAWSATDFASVVAMGPFFGIAVGAFAGFYRRFLAFSSPPRQRRSPSRGSGRTTGRGPGRVQRGRGNAPRTR